MLDGERRLDQPDDAGGALEMPDVGLDRADRQRPERGPAGPERGAERRRLDPIAELGAGAVQLDVLDVAALDARPAVGEPQDLFLRMLAGRRQALAAAVVVDRAAADHAVHVVAGGQRVGQRLEHDDGAALAADVAVGASIEGEAAPVRGEPFEPGGHDGAVRRDVQVHAARERQLGLAPAQALAREVNRDQRR